MTARQRSPDASHTRRAGGIGWNLWRAVVGVAFLGAAAFNLFVRPPLSTQRLVAAGRRRVG